MGKVIKDNLRFIITVALFFLAVGGVGVKQVQSNYKTNVNSDRIYENECSNKEDHEKILSNQEKHNDRIGSMEGDLKAIREQNKFIIHLLEK